MTAQEIQNVRTRQQWAEIISTDWRKSIEGIIQTGRDLIAAQDQLSERGFAKMVKDDLPFSRSTARKLSQIARHPKIGGGGAGACPLPASWSALVRLASLSVEEFEHAQQRGLIGADTSKRKAGAISSAYKTPVSGVVGEGKDVAILPTPKEAREVARATSRMVAASDGRLYSGATEEEGAEYVRRRSQTYAVIDAINTIVDSGVMPQDWCKEVKPHWLNRFEYGRIETATKWLDGLRLAFMRQKLVHDCEVEADGE